MESIRLGFGPRVPPEVLSQVLSWLYDSYDISDASRVCRAWYKIAFPHLHQHMTLRHITYLDTLTSRLESETKEKELQVGPCLRALTIKLAPDNLYESSSRPLLVRFERVLARLAALEFLELRYSMSPSLMSIFRSFESQCPRLRWVVIHRFGHETQALDDGNEDVFVFNNMKRLDIGWNHLDLQRPSHVPGALTRMVENSPELYELRLNLTGIEMDDEHVDAQWRPSDFFHRLKNPLLQLRVLAIEGEYAVNWESFFGDGSQCSLQQFFEHHPNLHTVLFRWSDERQVDLSFEPSLAERLFPSVREFAGPLALCAGVVGSQLAEQLQELTIYYELNDPIRPYNITFETFARDIKPLPKLQGLTIMCLNTDIMAKYPGQIHLDTNTLDMILAAMPNMQSILIGVSVGWTDIVSPLRHVPHLTEFHFVDSKRPDLENTIIFKRMVVEMFNICPMLRQIIGLRDEAEGGTLNIYRTIDRFGNTTEVAIFPT